MPTFADIILTGQESLVRAALHQRPLLNVIDEYGFTPLIETAIMDNAGMAQLLLAQGAEADLKDMTGSTALHWAAENNNIALARLLLEQGADPNAWNLSGQPVGVLPFLRKQREMKKMLEKAGANPGFIRDYVNTKQLGHLFELVGTGCILSPAGEMAEVSFEGFMPEVTLAMVAESLGQFQNHFAARSVRRYARISTVMTEVMHRAAQLIRFQQYRVNISRHQPEILSLLREDPLVIPVSFEGHAITFVRQGNLLVKCDRREDSRQFDTIVYYHVGRPDRLNNEFIQKMVFVKQSDHSINQMIPAWLSLSIAGHFSLPAQVSGNCSWANVEACIPVLFDLLYDNADGEKKDHPKARQRLAMEFFSRWREWNRERALLFALRRFQEAGPALQALLAETLAAVLFQACNSGTARDNERAERLIAALAESRCHYVLQNYVKVWAYEDTGPGGRHFLRLLRRYGYAVQER